MPLRIGETFAGYRILRLLGSGGMGEVYLVQHPRLPRQDALKVLRPDVSSDTSFRERFIREADLAAGLRHPHIVGIHDRGEHDGQLWIAMDYVDGTDAAQLIQQRYPAGMPAELAVPIITAVASALDYAHKKSLLHRDVKPANIIVADLDSDNPSVFLADFGIARPLEDTSGITTTNMTVGTVAYAAPEQLMAEQMDGRADEYALAATAYHLLSGVQLFPNSNPAVVISRHLNMTPPKLGDRRRRGASLDEVLQIAPRSASTAPARSPTNPPNTGSRRAWVVVGGVAAIILLVGVVTLAWRPWDSQRSNSAGATSTTQTTSTNQLALPPSVAMSPAPTVEPTKSDTTTPAVPSARFFGEWGQHSMSVTLAPDGSAHYAVWSGVANGTSWSATWSAMTLTTAMIVMATQPRISPKPPLNCKNFGRADRI